jgi:hypothetical protein
MLQYSHAAPLQFRCVEGILWFVCKWIDVRCVSCCNIGISVGYLVKCVCSKLANGCMTQKVTKARETLSKKASILKVCCVCGRCQSTSRRRLRVREAVCRGEQKSQLNIEIGLQGPAGQVACKACPYSERPCAATPASHHVTCTPVGHVGMVMSPPVARPPAFFSQSTAHQILTTFDVNVVPQILHLFFCVPYSSVCAARIREVGATLAW